MSPVLPSSLRFQIIAALAAFIITPMKAQTTTSEKAKAERRTELMNAWVYGQAVEQQFTLLLKKFPEHAEIIKEARTGWMNSAISHGKSYLEDEMMREGGESLRVRLQSLRNDLEIPAQTVAAIHDLTELKAFLQRVEKRARGQIEPPSIPGQLLSYNPIYRDFPEREMLEKYHWPVTTITQGLRITLFWPMSWKRVPPNNPNMHQKHVHVYGHGHNHGNLQVFPLPKGQTDEEAFTACTQVSETEYFQSLGLDLLSFDEFRFNFPFPHPKSDVTVPLRAASISSRKLRLKVATAVGPFRDNARIAVAEFKTFHSGKMIILFFNVPGPKDSPIAQQRLQKYLPLFRMVAESMIIEPAG